MLNAINSSIIYYFTTVQKLSRTAEIPKDSKTFFKDMTRFDRKFKELP